MCNYNIKTTQSAPLSIKDQNRLNRYSTKTKSSTPTSFQNIPKQAEVLYKKYLSFNSELGSWSQVAEVWSLFEPSKQTVIERKPSIGTLEDAFPDEERENDYSDSEEEYYSEEEYDSEEEEFLLGLLPSDDEIQIAPPTPSEMDYNTEDSDFVPSQDLSWEDVEQYPDQYSYSDSEEEYVSNEEEFLLGLLSSDDEIQYAPTTPSEMDYDTEDPDYIPSYDPSWEYVEQYPGQYRS
jgi:hypothetical protein